MGEGHVVFRLRPLDPARPLLGPMLASDALLTAIRRTAAIVCVFFAGLSLLVGNAAALSGADAATRGITGALAVGALGAGGWILTARNPLAGGGAIALAVFADVGVVVMVGLLDDPFHAAFAVFALVLPGVFVMVHLGRVWLGAHLALAFVAIVLLSLRATLTGSEPVPVAVAGMVLAVAVVVVTPWTMRRTILHILDRAERAFRDPVTGVLNRWGLEAALAGLASAPQTATITVMELDIDRFKAVNDEHGHDAGDRVLRQVAEDLDAFARSRGGVVARTGGEEFAVVVPGVVADLSSVPTVSGGRAGEPAVTLSAGLVTADVRSVAVDGAATVLAQADRLMYRAKRAGGGRAAREDGQVGPQS